MRKHLQKLGALLILSLSVAITAFGQTAIKGKVTDSKSAPLVGVSISVLGKTTGTVTDVDGNYLLRATPNDQLVISFIGFVSQTLAVGNKSVIDIQLQESNSVLDEVVVVGYGTQKKANMTGAVATVGFQELQNIPQASTINILSGRLPGVSVVQPGGEPGNDQGEIIVRGAGTLNDSSPLVIIDDVLSNLTTLNNISPVDIANITVLKDASSAAIYGARGANGVILVTTKEPQKKKLSVTVNLQNSIQTPTYLPKFVEPWQWMQLHNEATAPAVNYPQYLIDRSKAGQLSDSLGSTNWVDAVYRNGSQQNANVSLSGGNANASFQGSFGVLDQKGVIPGFTSRRYNYRSNISINTGKKTDIGINYYGYVQNNHSPYASSNTIVSQINQAFPIVPLFYANGNYGVNYPGYTGGSQAQTSIPNPLLTTTIGRDDRLTTNNNINTFFLYRPIDGLTFRTAFNYFMENQVEEAFNPTYDYRGVNPQQTGQQNLKNVLNNSTYTNRQYQVQFTGNYNKVLGKIHSINALIGYEYIDYQTSNFFAEGRDLPNNDQQVLGNALSDLRVGGDKAAWRLQSVFSRVAYVLRERYLLEGNLRIDGSSRFPIANKYGVFPSVSAGWILSNEPFFTPLAQTVSQLKLRAGYGVVGNDRIGNYPYQQVYSTRSFYPIGDLLNVGVSQNQFSNPDVRWERTTSMNAGVDLSLFHNKLNVNVDAFSKITDGILYQLSLPASFGSVTPANLNIANVSNKGWELNVEYRTRIGKNVNLNVGGNVAYVKNKVVKLNSRDAINGNFILREGYPINSYYLMVADGIYRDSTEFEKTPVFNNNANSRRVGALKLKDTNGDGQVNLDDRQPVHSANTPYTFGLTAGASFKGFDINMLLQGVAAKWIYIGDFGNRPGNAGNTNFWKEWWDNRYDARLNPNGTWPILKRQSPEAGTPNTFFLQNASYVRLRNVEIGYTIPKSLTKRIGLNTLRLYAIGTNLFTFSGLIKQIDPERPTISTGNAQYPQLKSVSIGLNAGF